MKNRWHISLGAGPPPPGGSANSRKSPLPLSLVFGYTLRLVVSLNRTDQRLEPEKLRVWHNNSTQCLPFKVVLNTKTQGETVLEEEYLVECLLQGKGLTVPASLHVELSRKDLFTLTEVMPLLTPGLVNVCLQKC